MTEQPAKEAKRESSVFERQSIEINDKISELIIQQYNENKDKDIEETSKKETNIDKAKSARERLKRLKNKNVKQEEKPEEEKNQEPEKPLEKTEEEKPKTEEEKPKIVEEIPKIEEESKKIDEEKPKIEEQAPKIEEEVQKSDEEAQKSDEESQKSEEKIEKKEEMPKIEEENNNEIDSEESNKEKNDSHKSSKSNSKEKESIHERPSTPEIRKIKKNEEKNNKNKGTISTRNFSVVGKLNSSPTHKRVNSSIDKKKERYKPYKVDKRKIIGYGKKYNEEEFNKTLSSFNLWEQKRKEKIQRLRYERDQKVYESMTKQNIHYNQKKKKQAKKNIGTNDVIVRLYIKDIQYRKEKKQILENTLKPTFKPELFNHYTSYKRVIHRNNNTKSSNKNNGYNGYRGSNYYDANDYEENEEEEDELVLKERKKKIDLTLRDMLFKHAKPIKRRNQSAVGRKLKTMS